MSRPPIKAIESIKKYCEKTHCHKCAFSRTVDYETHYVRCRLVEHCPVDWEIKTEKGDKEE